MSSDERIEECGRFPGDNIIKTILEIVEYWRELLLNFRQLRESHETNMGRQSVGGDQILEDLLHL